MGQISSDRQSFQSQFSTDTPTVSSEKTSSVDTSEIVRTTSTTASDPSSSWSLYSFLSAGASYIKSMTAGLPSLSSIGDALKQTAWSVYSFFASSTTAPSLNVSALKRKYGDSCTSQYQTTFLGTGDVYEKPSGAAIADYRTLPPQETTQTILSGEVKLVSEMGFSIPDMGNKTDGLMPQGATRIFGKKERASLSKGVSEKLSRMKENTKPVKLSRITVKINGSSFCFEEDTPTDLLDDLKKEFKSLDPSLSDNDIKDILLLMNNELQVSGFPSGNSQETGYNHSRSNLLPHNTNIFEITALQDSKIKLHYDSGKSYMSGIQFPSKDKVGGAFPLSSYNDSSGNEDKIDPATPPPDIPIFICEENYTYTYTPHKNNSPASVEVTDSRQIYYPASQIEELSEECRTAIEKKMNSEIALKTEASSSRDWMLPYSWPNTAGPKLAYQFVVSDLDRARYYISDKHKTIPLYSPAASNEELTDNKITEAKLAAAQAFVNFVGNVEQALLISQAANQQIAFNGDLLEDVMKSTGALLKHPLYGVGTIVRKQGGTAKTMTFSKSPEGEVMLHVRLRQNPGMFNPSVPSPDDISLNSEKSYVNIDYDITFAFDKEENLTLKVGPIHRASYLEPSS